jgi:hypothetical protein
MVRCILPVNWFRIDVYLAGADETGAMRSFASLKFRNNEKNVYVLLTK